MSDLAVLLDRLVPVLDAVRALDITDPARAKAQLDAAFPVDGPLFAELRVLVRRGVEEGWLADREANGIRFSRVRKASAPEELSIDAVHMDKAGPGHTHPNGEVDLSFVVTGEPTFDGAPEGWMVYPPNTWHVPTVAGGAMDILYFLPAGAIRFEANPAS